MMKNYLALTPLTTDLFKKLSDIEAKFNSGSIKKDEYKRQMESISADILIISDQLTVFKDHENETVRTMVKKIEETNNKLLKHIRSD